MWSEAMTGNIGAAIAGLTTSVLWYTNAFAAGEWLPGGGDDGGGTASTPEIDGPGAVLAVALLVSLGVMIYRKAQK
jgi:hypothetical protein